MRCADSTLAVLPRVAVGAWCSSRSRGAWALVARACAGIAGIAGIAGCGGAGAGAGATATDSAQADQAALVSLIDRGDVRSVVPGAPGAAIYQSEPAARRTDPAVDDPLRAQLFFAIRKAAADGGITVLADDRLDAAMTDLARSMRDDEQPASGAVEFLLGHYGVVEPYPVIRFVRARREVQDQVLANLVQTYQLPTQDKLVALGIGLDRATSQLSLIVAAQPKLLDLAPIERAQPGGATLALTGALLAAYRNPSVYVTDPGGTPRSFPLVVRGAAFRAEVPCDRGDGRYQLEVFGEGAMGPAVLANFPVFCGAEPPASYDGGAGYVAVVVAPADAERALLAHVNEARAAAGLSQVSPDPALADVARRHSEDMRRNGFFAHISPKTGTPMDRVQAAGLAYRRVLENIGKAGSPDEVHAGLMRSPGHRRAILDRDATHVGIGVVVDAPEGGVISVYATELFR